MFRYFMSLFVPFPANFYYFLPFLVFLSPFYPFCPFLSCSFLHLLVKGDKKGRETPLLIMSTMAYSRVNGSTEDNSSMPVFTD